jgi:hypothetical protein
LRHSRLMKGWKRELFSFLGRWLSPGSCAWPSFLELDLGPFRDLSFVFSFDRFGMPQVDLFVLVFLPFVNVPGANPELAPPRRIITVRGGRLCVSFMFFAFQVLRRWFWLNMDLWFRLWLWLRRGCCFPQLQHLESFWHPFHA